MKKRLENSQYNCITEHRGFTSNCLDEYVLEASFYEYCQSEGPLGDGEMLHEWVISSSINNSSLHYSYWGGHSFLTPNIHPFVLFYLHCSIYLYTVYTTFNTHNLICMPYKGTPQFQHLQIMNNSFTDIYQRESRIIIIHEIDTIVISLTLM